MIERHDLALLGRSIGKIVREGMDVVTARVDLLEQQTKSSNIGPLSERIAALEHRIVQCERACDAHRKHLGNLELKIAKLIEIQKGDGAWQRFSDER